ncbi:GerAB/ArcD/ProY family transporter [Sutcliffiella rhizosphaerae]|uniref:Spore germination protein A2 n=1 Tax=Sutcliffiella rhizosphaerae TaxID=2880967 RepID=A0ABM8YLG9_9BACI|nr:GerAB/ArcD/ProY family transporter [Sutcliffiella rhizosphaerae]CAG9620589.1 Spore germination protein A2 [Sutcliffiella rhizosphaerae]
MQKIPTNFQISPFLVFFLIHGTQFGVGALGYQRIIAMAAGYDAWIGIILFGALTHIIVYMIYKICEKSNGDIVSAHRLVFGKWIGNIFNLFFVFYFIFTAVTVLRSYIEVVQVWLFPDLKTWFFSLIFLMLVFYLITGGFRVITGISFLGVVLPSYLVLTIIMPLEYANFRNLLPIFDHPIKDILKSGKDMTLSMLGFEALLLYYPYIKNPEKSKKWAQFGIFITSFIYLVFALVTFAYFSEGKLQKNIWATLSIWKIIELPFVERVEYIGIANWCLIILPNVCIFLWCSSRLAKRMSGLKQRTTLIFITLVVLILMTQFEDRKHINDLNKYIGEVGFYMGYVYIPILFLFVTFVYWRKGKKKNAPA